MRKIISITIGSIIILIAGISIFKMSDISRREPLNTNNDLRNVKDFKEANELETQQNLELEDNGLNEQLKRQDTQGEVAVTVTFLNPTHQDKDYLNFEIYLNTHSVELDKYNLEELTTLSIGNNIKIREGIEWETIGGGHHISGTLKVPKEYKGEKINYTEAEFIELEVMDLADASSRRFKWKKEELQVKENN